MPCSFLGNGARGCPWLSSLFSHLGLILFPFISPSSLSERPPPAPAQGWSETIEWFKANWLPSFRKTSSYVGLASKTQEKIDIQASVDACGPLTCRGAGVEVCGMVVERKGVR